MTHDPDLWERWHGGANSAPRWTRAELVAALRRWRWWRRD